jgi:hypothetical protein
MGRSGGQASETLQYFIESRTAQRKIFQDDVYCNNFLPQLIVNNMGNISYGFDCLRVNRRCGMLRSIFYWKGLIMQERCFGPVRFIPGQNNGKYPNCHSIYIEGAGVLIDPASDRDRLIRLKIVTD